MELAKILNGIEYKSNGDVSIEIKTIEDNSKKVKPGSMFFAIKGFDFDGNEFVSEAIENGAIAVVLDINSDLKGMEIPKNIITIIVSDTRKALAVAACNFFGNPSKYFTLIGVTGTKGKTTTTHMIKAILEKAGKKVGLIGTIYNYIGDECLGASNRTTPGSIELQKLFYQMARAKVDVVVMEVSSQSLKYNRVLGTHFDIGIFTNFYKDHISKNEHPDMEDYFNSKLKLFSMCKKAYVNADDFKSFKVVKESPNCEFKSYGIDNTCDLLAKDITITNVNVDYKLKIGTRNERIKVNIPGRFSVYNSLAAISVCVELGAKVEHIKDTLETITVPGRSEMISTDKEVAIMIDYAHTAESLESILMAVKTYTKGRVICVFGCGGDRDKTKRPLMGEKAGRIADFTFVTTDNPRSEEPQDIIEDIKVGINKTKGKYKVIVDRKEAIKEAIAMLNKKDILVIAGKGHETYQEVNGEKLPFDEREIVQEFLKTKIVKK